MSQVTFNTSLIDASTSGLTLGLRNTTNTNYTFIQASNGGTLSTETATCPPDLYGDHSVGLDDLTILLSNFGVQSGAAGAQGDLDGRGDVDISDLAAILATFGTPCP